MPGLHFGIHHLALPGEDGVPGLSVDFGKFKNLIELLSARAQPMTLEEYVARRKVGELPPKWFSLSFDDNLKQAATRALGLLQQMEIPATFFVPTCTLMSAGSHPRIPGVIALQVLIGECGVPSIEGEVTNLLRKMGYTEYLSREIGDSYNNEPEEVRWLKTVLNVRMPHLVKEELVSVLFARLIGDDAERRWCEEHFMDPDMLYSLSMLGHSVGAHTVTHLNMLSAWERGEHDLVRDEIRTSVAAIIELGLSCRTFAYTFGGRMPREIQQAVLGSRQLAAAANFEYTPGIDLGYDPGNDFNLVRVDPNNFTLDEVRKFFES